MLLKQLLSNSIIQQEIFKVFEEKRGQAYSGVLNATGAESLFRAQGKLWVWDEVLLTLKKLRGDNE